MGTLILVHGTFAAGAEAGNKWWQKGSQFEAHMRDLLETDSELTFERVRWDGKNSVSSRRETGKKLHARMLELERIDEPYSVVGHSHGGSVIGAALMRAAIQGQPLPGLEQWITVGTPFIETEKDRFLFSRLGLVGKTVYVAITSFAVFALLASLATFEGNKAVIAVLVLAVLPFLVVYCLLQVLNARRFNHFRRMSLAAFDRYFSDRWLGLWHKDDEPIDGLKALTRIRRPIFGKGFAVPIFSMLAIYVFPLVLYALVSSTDIAQRVLGYHLDHFGSAKLEGIAKDEVLIGKGTDLGINFNLLLTTAWEAVKTLFPGKEQEAQAVFLMVAVPLMFLILALLIVLAVNLVARPLSIAASALLNRSAWQQIRQKGFGGDVPGERAVGSEPFPKGVLKRFAPLPEELGREIAKTSDAAAAKAITKLRGAIGNLALSEGERGADLVAEYLSWNELIHTTYFDVPHFRKLLAYSIAQADSFRASDTFKQDGDYDTVAGWYRRLTEDVSGQAPPKRG